MWGQQRLCRNEPFLTHLLRQPQTWGWGWGCSVSCGLIQQAVPSRVNPLLSTEDRTDTCKCAPEPVPVPPPPPPTSDPGEEVGEHGPAGAESDLCRKLGVAMTAMPVRFLPTRHPSAACGPWENILQVLQASLEQAPCCWKYHWKSHYHCPGGRLAAQVGWSWSLAPQDWTAGRGASAHTGQLLFSSEQRSGRGHCLRCHLRRQETGVSIVASPSCLVGGCELSQGSGL